MNTIRFLHVFTWKVLKVYSGMNISIVALFLYTIYFSVAGSLPQEEKTTRKPLNHLQCTRDDDCSDNAYCHYGRCACLDGYLPYRETVKSPTKCVTESAGIDDYCQKDFQCQAALGRHSLCMQNDPRHPIGKCQCSDDAHYISKICYKTAIIGGSCDANENCLIKSSNLKAFCQHSRCICPPNHHPTHDGTDCIRTSVLGGPCLTNEGCITLNARCKKGICTCQREYMPSFDNMTCLLVAKRLGDPCDEDGQCLVAHHFVTCDKAARVCICEEGAHMADGTCWKTAKLLEPCGDNNECRADPGREHSVECSQGICQCRSGYQIEDQKECVKWDRKAFGSAAIPEVPILLVLSSPVLTTVLIAIFRW